MQTGIDFFVFYLDMTLESENGRQDALVLDSFMARHRSLILTSRIQEYRQMFPHAAAIGKWQANLPTPFFLKQLIQDFDARMESIAYVSDDFDFCRIASGSFATTMLINTVGLQDRDYGRIPDFTCSGVGEFAQAMESGTWRFFGEGIVFTDGKTIHRGKSGKTSIIVDGHQVNVKYAGRYFKPSHYRSCIDFYSLALRKNKDQTSRLYCRFDAVFLRIFRAMTRSICTNQHIDAICSIPDNRTQKQVGGRFAKMVVSLSAEFSIDNIQPFLHKNDNGQAPQKSMTSAMDRMENISGAFRCDISLKGRRVLVIDDIITTGSTLRECSRVLFEAGASEVTCAVLAANQFSTDYWFSDQTLEHFRTTHQLNGNSHNLRPFFTNTETGRTSNFNVTLAKLYDELNASVTALENPVQEDDDRGF